MKYLLTITLILTIATIQNFNCSEENTNEKLKNKKATELKSIEKVLEEYTPYLMTIPGVVGTAIGECDEQPCIKVLVSTYHEELEAKIPSSLEGYTVVIEEIGEVRAF